MEDATSFHMYVYQYVAYMAPGNGYGSWRNKGACAQQCVHHYNSMDVNHILIFCFKFIPGDQSPDSLAHAIWRLPITLTFWYLLLP